MFSIIISEKGGAERREAFDQPELNIGRVQGNDLLLPKGNVSKRHARLVYRDARFIVTDLNSTNGTYVNRRRINQATIVRQGDRIYIGDFVLRVELPAEDSSTLDRASVGSERSREAMFTSPDISQISRAPHRDGEPTGSYPSVPPAPRPPSSASLDPPSAVPSAPRVSERAPGIREDSVSGELVTYRSAVGALAARVLTRFEPRALDRDITDAAAVAVRRAIDEDLEALRNEGVIGAAIVEDRVKRDVAAELLELGPLAPMLEDDTVTELSVVGTHAIIVDRSGQRSALEPALSSEAAVRRVLSRLARLSGQPIAADESIVRRELPGGFSLLGLNASSATGGTLIKLERPQRIDVTLDDLVRAGTISRGIATFLKHCVVSRANILVVGSLGAKTSSILCALASASNEHAAVIRSRDAFVSGRVSVTEIDAALAEADPQGVFSLITQMTAVRMVVERLSGAVATGVLDAIAAGAQGVLAALVAPTIWQGLARLPAELATVRPGVTAQTAQQWLAGAFDVILEVATLRDGRSRVLRVCEPGGVEAGEIQTRDIFQFVVERTATGGLLEGTFHPSGSHPRILDDLAARGVTLESSLFSRPPSR